MYNNQQLLPFVIISTILLTIIHDSGSILRGEIKSTATLSGWEVEPYIS